MQFVLANTIPIPDGCEAIVSNDGKFIATRRIFSDYQDKEDSINIFDNYGNHINSVHCLSSGENGMAFWPDNNHILAPGFSEFHCGWPIDADGLKLFSLVNKNEKRLMFADTPIYGINTNLFGVSNSGRFILCSGQSSGIHCIDVANKNQSMKINKHFTNHLFLDDKLLILIFSQIYCNRYYTQQSEVFSIPDMKSINVLQNETALAFCSQNRKLITYTNDNLNIYNLSDNGRFSKDHSIKVSNAIVFGTFSTNGAIFATLDFHQTISFFSADTNDFLGSIPNIIEDEIYNLKYVPDNRIVAISKNKISIWAL